MAYLEIGTTPLTVYVAVGPTRRETEELGDRDRAFAGTMRESLRGRKRNWQVQTIPLPRSDADALETALQATPPISCSGDLLGESVNCHARVRGWRSLVLAGTEHVILEFDLMEA